MSNLDFDAMIEILEGDLDLIQSLVSHGLIAENAQSFVPEEVEMILVSRTLVRDLGVNWEGVEVILRMRHQLLVTRLRLAELLGSVDEPA